MEKLKFNTSSAWIVLLLRIAASVVADECKGNDSDPSKVAYTITVSKSGQSNFTTVQDAVDSIPFNNDRWIRIHVMSSIYKERVEITRDKRCIVLEGQSSSNTTITNDLSNTTFVASADNFVMKNITIENTFRQGAAVALRAGGDKCSFWFCGFVGYQDTLWDASGRHYFYRCYIEGATDFIFGDGQSVYQNAHIRSSHPGFITAQAREFPDDAGGFVFIGGYVLGSGPTYLGRAWRPYSRVIFQKTYFADIIAPLGWNAWLYPGHDPSLCSTAPHFIADFLLRWFPPAPPSGDSPALIPNAVVQSTQYESRFIMAPARHYPGGHKLETMPKLTAEDWLLIGDSSWDVERIQINKLRDGSPSSHGNACI
ncbi:putative pectinesterase 55 [Drosera capensis]